MKFKDWMMNEVGTSTADIAGFARITLPLIRRQWPSEFSFDEFKRKKKALKQPQVEEAAKFPQGQP